MLFKIFAYLTRPIWTIIYIILGVLLSLIDVALITLSGIAEIVIKLLVPSPLLYFIFPEIRDGDSASVSQCLYDGMCNSVNTAQEQLYIFYLTNFSEIPYRVKRQQAVRESLIPKDEYREDCLIDAEDEGEDTNE